MPPHVWFVVLHPILITLLVLIALVPLLRWAGLWARYKYRILLALLATHGPLSRFYVSNSKKMSVRVLAA